MKSVAPKSVVRFYGNIEYALDALVSRQVAFVRSSSLNDPFDPYFGVDFDVGYFDLLEYVRANHTASDFGWFLQKYGSPVLWEEGVARVKSYMDDTKRSTFVFSTCGILAEPHPKENLYMWGHYANGHRGIAIEFNTEALTRKNPISPKLSTGKIWENDDIWIRVEYANEIPRLGLDRAFDFFRDVYYEDFETPIVKSVFNNIGRLKSRNWEAEQEWRLLWHNDETEASIWKVGIDIDAVTAVYMGILVSDDIVERVQGELKANWPDAKLFRAKRGRDFNLNFVQI